jgi:tRNA 2-thiocytidine biosynthesis protein TtcA
MLREWEKQHPGRIDNMHRAFANVVPSHLMDRALFPFETIRPTGEVNLQGDKAFDEDEDDACATPTAVAGLPAEASISLTALRRSTVESSGT